MYQDVEVINVSKEGFTAVCKSVLKAGSGANIPLSWQAGGGDDQYDSSRVQAPAGGYSYNINIPTTVTHIWVTGEISAYAISIYRDGHTDWVGWDIGSVTVSTNTGQRQEHPNYVDGRRGELVVNGRETKSFTFDMDVSNVSTVTVSFSFGEYPYKNSYAKMISYRTSLDTDTTICQGTAGFIAIDPNTVPYSIS